MLSAVLVVAGPSADAQTDWSQIGVDIDGETADDYVRLVGGDECCW